MEVPVPPTQIGGMKHSTLIAEIIVAVGTTTQARESTPADVTAYVSGDKAAPSSVDQGARAVVSWIFDRIGVRLAWHDGEAPSGLPSPTPFVIQIQFTGEAPAKASSGALAYTSPFREGATTVNVMYDRIRWIAGRSTREEAILAYVLAHEIGHILQGTNAHTQTGIMKAHWSGQDYDAMERRQLRFTSTDLDLIRDGLNARKSQRAYSSLKTASNKQTSRGISSENEDSGCCRYWRRRIHARRTVLTKTNVGIVTGFPPGSPH